MSLFMSWMAMLSMSQWGAVEHPMTEEHYIEWICLETEHGIQYAHLDPDDEPRAKFALCEGDEVRAVYAFCNQHDLWRN